MILDYRDMAADSVRVEAFRRGIEAAVRPGDVVMDIGCGLGTYAVFACRAGARKVYAVEREDVIAVARRIARDNGCADRIEFFHGDALAVELPERADVVITEDFAPTFVDGETERLVAHARRRFLARGGRFVPRAAVVFAAPVACPRRYAQIVPGGGTGGRAGGLDFSAVRGMVLNCIHRAQFRPAELLAAPKAAHRVDLAAGTAFGFDARLAFRARKRAIVHGVAVWFDALLARGVRLSNAPGAPPTLWGQGLLPLVRPVRARKGGTVTVDLAARIGRDSRRVWWQWQVAAGGEVSDGTTFRSFPTSLAALEAGSRNARPGLSEEGEITAFVLRMLGRRCRIIEVARGLRRRFPARFRGLKDALARASADARRYGRRPKL